MEFVERVNKIRELLKPADVSKIQGKLAFQINLEGEGGGIFYIEVKDGVLSVEPYDYIDRDALFIISVENFEKLVARKLDPVQAYTDNILKVEGDLTKALQIQEILPEPASEEAEDNSNKETTNTTKSKSSNSKTSTTKKGTQKK